MIVTVLGIMLLTMRKFFRLGTIASALLTAALFITGCASAGYSGESSSKSLPPATSGSDILRVGDQVTVVFSDLPPPPTLPFQERVNDDGKITLLLNQSFQAAGKTRGALEIEIRERYVPRFYKNLTVTVKPLDRFYFVDGEVKHADRFIYNGETTVLKAIASAQGFTDFANKKKVHLTRATGEKLTVNCVDAVENSHLDLPVYPGDKIQVPRRFF